jgi:transcriptional regulator with XRE-family HTH domain
MAGLKKPEPVDKHVGSRVRMRRLMLGMSQEKLADAIGLTFQQVQKYEKGTNRMGSSRLHQIANVLQVPVPFFFEGASGPSNKGSVQPEVISDFLSTADGLALVRAFMKLSNETLRRDIVRLVHTIAEFG